MLAACPTTLAATLLWQALAGRSGRVFTLLRHEDVKHFKGMLRKADNAFVSDHKLARDVLEAARPEVEQALQEMQVGSQHIRVVR